MMPASPLQSSLDLLDRAQRGDQDALDRLLDRYYLRVLSLVRMRLGLGLRAHVTSLDITQEAMMRMVKDLEHFEPHSEAALINWISKLVENEIRDQASYYKAQKRQASREVPLTVKTEASAATGEQTGNAHDLTASGKAEQQEDMDKLATALDELGNNREVILLHDFSGMNFREVGNELHISEDAARMRYVRAVDKLTDIITSKHIQFNRPHS